MITEIPTEKACPNCEQLLLASAFSRDKSRRDGLSYTCKECTGSYTPKKKRPDYSNLSKPCDGCGRVLLAKFFLSSHGADEYNLSKLCRTCKAWKGKEPLTADQADEHDRILDEMILGVLSAMMDSYPECDTQELLASHRCEFESLCAKFFEGSRLNQEWKLPVWVKA